MGVLQEMGATILANACGACIGQWRRTDVSQGEKNSIINSFNRNFSGRNDANPGTHSFIASPEIVTAFALAGRLDFNPLTDTLVNENGDTVTLDPQRGDELPGRGFIKDKAGLSYRRPSIVGWTWSSIRQRAVGAARTLCALERPGFRRSADPGEGQGKCTTTYLAGRSWSRYPGHLDTIRVYRVVIATVPVGKGKNLLTGENDVAYAAIARSYKADGLGWVAIADENYGEGSSREHAAMEPRYLGGVAVIARSFARIAETNLKKQGVLPLTFENPADYDKIREDDRVSSVGCDRVGARLEGGMVISHADGSVDEQSLIHTFSDNQIEWVKAGSALNLIRQRQSKK